MQDETHDEHGPVYESVRRPPCSKLGGGRPILGIFTGQCFLCGYGDVYGREFYTGLPDGEYCDIVQECGQTIEVGAASSFRAVAYKYSYKYTYKYT